MNDFENERIMTNAKAMSEEEVKAFRQKVDCCRIRQKIRKSRTERKCFKKFDCRKLEHGGNKNVKKNRKKCSKKQNEKGWLYSDL